MIMQIGNKQLHTGLNHSWNAIYKDIYSHKHVHMNLSGGEGVTNNLVTSK